MGPSNVLAQGSLGYRVSGSPSHHEALLQSHAEVLVHFRACRTAKTGLADAFTGLTLETVLGPEIRNAAVLQELLPGMTTPCVWRWVQAGLPNCRARSWFLNSPKGPNFKALD